MGQKGAVSRGRNGEREYEERRLELGYLWGDMETVPWKLMRVTLVSTRNNGVYRA